MAFEIRERLLFAGSLSGFAGMSAPGVQKVVGRNHEFRNSGFGRHAGVELLN